MYIMGWILLGIGVVGFGLGGYWDLRTTEFPDWLPYSMIILALLTRGAYSVVSGNYSFLTNSVILGVLFLSFGLLLYYSRQWGDGDAWMLGALGFLFPDPAGFSVPAAALLPFPMIIFFNFFIISLFYLIAYAIFLGLRSPEVYASFKQNLRDNARLIACIFGFLLILSTGISLYFLQAFGMPISEMIGILSMPVLALLLLMFLQYARAVEGDLFKRKVPVKRLRVGDVLISDRWRGLTEPEVKKLQKRGGHVWIKEGVRFAPVFIICVLVTFFYGSLWNVMFPIL